MRVTQPCASAERDLAPAREALAAALRAGNASEAALAYAEGATLVAPPAEVVEGRAAIEAFWRAGMQMGTLDIDFVPFGLERRDGTAYELGTYRLCLEGEAGSVVDRGTYMVVHERQPDGSWLRAAEMLNADGVPSAQPPGRTP
jgi:ketosteroid isomerase-like protein